MTHRVFVYQTLRAKRIREEALGESHRDVPTQAACVRDFAEYFVGGSRHGWPNLTPAPGITTDGDLLTVTDTELAKLDAWESRYERRSIVVEPDTTAWVYLLK